MKRRQVTALLLSAIMTLSTCMPINGISAFAAENTGAGSTEAAVVEPESEEQAEKTERNTAKESVESTEEPAEELTVQEEPAEQELEEADISKQTEAAGESGTTEQDQPTEQVNAEEQDQPTEQANAEEQDQPTEQANTEEQNRPIEQENHEEQNQPEEQVFPEETTEEISDVQTVQKSKKECVGYHILTAYIDDGYGRDTYAWMNVHAGEPVELKVAAYTSNGEKPKFTWYEGSTNSDPLDENGATCTVEGPSEYDESYYYCVVTDNYGHKITCEFNLYGSFVDNHENVDFGTAEEIKIGDVKRVRVSWKDAYYKFVPESSGMYKFYLESESSRNARLYDSSQNELENAYSYTSDNNFLINHELTAGETYYLAVNANGNQSSLTVYVVKETLKIEDSKEQDIYLNNGDKATLGVEAYSDSPITYSWQISTEEGASKEVECDQSSYAFTPMKNCTVFCTVSDGSETATVTFNVYIQNNVSFAKSVNGKVYGGGSYEEIAIKYNEAAVLNVDVAEGDAEGVTYQWYKEYVEIEGATAPSYTAEHIIGSHETYTCYIYDRFGNRYFAYFYLSAEFDDDHKNVDFDTAVEIKAGDEKTVKVSEEKQNAYYKFVPERSGIYRFCLEADRPVYASLYNSKKNYVYVSDYYGASNNYSFEYRFKAGKTYYFKAGYNDYYSNQGIFTARLVEKSLTANSVGSIYKQVYAGDEVTLDVSANSQYDIKYTWIVDKKEIDCSDRSYTFKPQSSNVVECVINDGVETEKVEFYISIINDLKGIANIEGLPKNNSSKITANVESGKPISLCADVTATDLNGVTYQWYKDIEKEEGGYTSGYGTAIDGATSAVYTIGELTRHSTYGCLIKDKYDGNEFLEFDLSVENHFTVYPEGAEGEKEKYLFAENGLLELNVNVAMDDDEGVICKWLRLNTDGWYYEELDNASANPYTYMVKSSGKYEEYRFYLCDKYENEAFINFYINCDYASNELKAYTINAQGKNGRWCIKTINPGEDVTLPVYVTAIVTDGIKYQWYYKAYNGESEDYGSAIDGEIFSEYTVDHNDSQHYKPGYYECVVTDRFNNQKSVIFSVAFENRLKAYVSDRDEHVREIEYTVPYGENKILSVEASAVDMEHITYRWYKRTDEIDEKGKPVYKELDGETANKLKSDAVKGMLGYRCTVKDQYENSADVYFDLHARNEWTAYPDGATENEKSIHIKLNEGESTTLKVNVKKKEASADLSQIQYVWYTDDPENALTADEGHPDQYTITEAVRSETIYCNVSDQYGNETLLEFGITVNYKPEIYPSSVPKGIKDSEIRLIVYVEKGGSVTLKANLQEKHEDQEYTYDWYHMDYEDYYEGSFHQVLGDDPSLTLDHIYEPEEYYCIVGTDYNWVHVGSRVYFEIRIQNHLKAYPEGGDGADTAYIIARPGNNVNLRTTVEADSAEHLQYEWCRTSDGESMDVNADTLEVDASNAEYRCTVKDKYGNTACAYFEITLETLLEAYPEGAGTDQYGDKLNYVELTPKDGDKLNLNVIASSTADGLKYDWEKQEKYTNFWGEDEYDYVTTGDQTHNISIAASESTKYKCIVTDGSGREKEVYFNIRVGSLEAHPEGSDSDRISITVKKGGTKKLKVITNAADGAKLSYKWTVGPLHDSGWWPLEEGQESTTDELEVSLEESLRYQCVVKDQNGNQAMVYFYVNVDGMEVSTDAAEGLKLTGDNRYDVKVPIKLGEEKKLTTNIVAENPDTVTYLWEMVDMENDAYHVLAGETDNSVTAKGGEASLYICHVSDENANNLLVFYYMVTDNELKVMPDGATGDEKTVEVYASQGEKVTLGVTATATDMEGIEYDWRNPVKNKIGKSSKCTVTVEKDGTYYCNVYDKYENEETATFRILVKEDQIIKKDQTPVCSVSNINYGNTATFAVTGAFGSIMATSNTPDVAAVTVNGSNIVVTGKNSGKATLTITAAGDDTHNEATITRDITVNKINQSMTAALSSAKILTGTTSKVTVSGVKESAKLTYSSSKVAVATVSAAGVITAKGAGTATITVTAAATTNYNAASRQVTVSVLPGATSKFTAAAATNGKGIKLTWKKVAGATQYQIYRNNKLLKTVGNVATFTDTKANTNGSKYTFKIVAKASTGASTQSKSVVYYKVNRPAVKKLTNSASKKMTVKWAKNAKSTGYEIQYGLKKNFKGAKTTKINKRAAVAKTISNLKKGKTYYVRIRTFKKVGKKIYYSAWSTKKSVKIKK